MLHAASAVQVRGTRAARGTNDRLKTVPPDRFTAAGPTRRKTGPIDSRVSSNLAVDRRPGCQLAVLPADADILNIMPTSLPSAAAQAGSDAWQELEEVLAELGQLARAPLAPDDFYEQTLAASLRALSAVGGAVWLRGDGGSLQPVAQINWPGAMFAADAAARSTHEALLSDAAAHGGVVAVGPRTAGAAGRPGNPTEFPLVFVPVRMTGDHSHEEAVSRSPVLHTAATTAILEIVPRADVSPATHRGYEQFLTAVAEIAGEYHAHRELARLRLSENYRDQLVRLSSLVHRHIDLVPTAYAVANEGRRVIGCDRLSVLSVIGRRSRLLATSGASRVERRSGAARRLEQLAHLVGPIGDPAYYADGQCDALPQIAEALEAHAEESQARQVAVLPLSRPELSQNEALDLRRPAGRPAAPAFVLVAEQFDARHGELRRERLVEVGELCTTALYNALEVDQLPLRWLLRPLGVAKQQITSHLTRSALIAAALAAAVAALALVPADFTIEATGTLEPAVRQDVFVPRSGLVNEVLVDHGSDVAAGQSLVQLRDPTLDLELQRVQGEMETVRRQLAAAQATKSSREVRDANPAELYRLSASEREYGQRLTNLQRELDLLRQQRESLTVRSPLAGRVLTWDVANRLVARPVERGEVLLTVADMSTDWQLELNVADDLIGHVLAAQSAAGPDLPVRFRLRSDDEPHTGHVESVSMVANVDTGDNEASSPTVEVIVAFDKTQLDETILSQLRPGVSARAEIDCGRRSLGYVWFHDILDAIITWIRF